MFPEPVTTLTCELVKPGALDIYKNKGYTYIRQVHRPYNLITRDPSVGCIVELSCYRDIGSHLIDSPKGRKLIRRISYFGYL
jgi:hypothetical protein